MKKIFGKEKGKKKFWDICESGDSMTKILKNSRLGYAPDGWRNMLEFLCEEKIRD